MLAGGGLPCGEMLGDFAARQGPLVEGRLVQPAAEEVPAAVAACPQVGVARAEE